MKTNSVTGFNLNTIHLIPTASKRTSWKVSDDTVSFSGLYSDKTITELAPIIRNELFNLKKAPSKTPFEKGKISYKKYIYPKLLGLYEQYIEGSFNKNTAESIRKLEAERRSYISKPKNEISSSGGIGNYINRYLGYPIFTKLTLRTNNAHRISRIQANAAFHGGRLSVAKSSLVKEMLDRLSLIADDYINGNGIYFNKVSFSKNPENQEDMIRRAQAILRENIPIVKNHSEITPEDIEKMNIVSDYEKLNAEQAVYSDRLAKNWTQADKDKYREVTDKLVELEEIIVRDNISLVPKKTEADFSTDPILREREIHHYMHGKVFPNMTETEASALDGLDMFKKFGKKEEGRIGSTIFSMALDMARLPQHHKTEKVFSKYLDVMEQFGQNGNYDDAHSVAVVLTDFIKSQNPNEISKDSILRAMRMIKDFSQGIKKVRFVYNALSKSKYGNDADISSSLKEFLKMMKNREG